MQVIMMPITKLHKLHPVLVKFSLEAVPVILQRGTMIKLEPDQVLYSEKDLTLKVYLIVYGTFELMRPQAG